MTTETERIVYQVHRDAQNRYTYFLLAVAGAGIAFAVQQTRGDSLAWSQIPLGLAVLAWGLSFYCGCMNLQYVLSTMFANMALFKIEKGKDPEVGTNPERILAASQGVRDAMAGNQIWCSRYARAQFALILVGAALFIAWHVWEMCLTVTPVAQP